MDACNRKGNRNAAIFYFVVTLNLLKERYLEIPQSGSSRLHDYKNRSRCSVLILRLGSGRAVL